MDRETQLEILQQRARETAKEKTKAEIGERMEILHFSLHPEHFAIESAYVKEVITLENLTPLPGIPGFIMGIMNYRGTILSAVNLRNFLNLTETGLSEMNKVIVVGNQDMEFGVVADKILGTEKILKSKISELPHSLSDKGRELFKGLIKNEVTLLDGEKLLYHDQMKIGQRK